MNYTKIKKHAALLLIHASGLSASLTTQEEKTSDDKPNDLVTQYNNILNGKIEAINIWDICFDASSLSTQKITEQKEAITAEVNKAIKLIKQQPLLALKQSETKKRNALMYLAVTGNIKQIEEILDSLPSDKWNNTYTQLYNQTDIDSHSTYSYTINYPSLHFILETPQRYKGYKRRKLRNWWTGLLIYVGFLSLGIGLVYWTVFSKKA